MQRLKQKESHSSVKIHGTAKLSIELVHTAHKTLHLWDAVSAEFHSKQLNDIGLWWWWYSWLSLKRALLRRGSASKEYIPKSHFCIVFLCFAALS